MCTGFAHEHTRYDRDAYITLTPAFPGACDNIDYASLEPGEDIAYHEYDYCSVMHYGEDGPYACRLKPKNNSWSCTVNGHHVTKIGQRWGLSPKGDIPDIMARYCSQYTLRIPTEAESKYEIITRCL